MGSQNRCLIKSCNKASGTIDGYCLDHFKECLDKAYVTISTKRFPKHWKKWPLKQKEIYINFLADPEAIKYILLRDSVSIVKNLCCARLRDIGARVPIRKSLKCKVRGCLGGPDNNGQFSHGLCHTHYSQYNNGIVDKNGKKVRPKVSKNKKKVLKCKVDGCDKKSESKSFCSKHYRQFRQKKRDIHGNALCYIEERGDIGLTKGKLNRIIVKIDQLKKKTKILRDEAFSSEDIDDNMKSLISYLDDGLKYIYRPKFVMAGFGFFENITTKILLAGESIGDPVPVTFEIVSDSVKRRRFKGFLDRGDNGNIVHAEFETFGESKKKSDFAFYLRETVDPENFPLTCRAFDEIGRQLNEIKIMRG